MNFTTSIISGYNKGSPSGDRYPAAVCHITALENFFLYFAQWPVPFEIIPSETARTG